MIIFAKGYKKIVVGFLGCGLASTTLAEALPPRSAHLQEAEELLRQNKTAQAYGEKRALEERLSNLRDEIAADMSSGRQEADIDIILFLEGMIEDNLTSLRSFLATTPQSVLKQDYAPFIDYWYAQKLAAASKENGKSLNTSYQVILPAQKRCKLRRNAILFHGSNERFYVPASIPFYVGAYCTDKTFALKKVSSEIAQPAAQIKFDSFSPILYQEDLAAMGLPNPAEEKTALPSSQQVRPDAANKDSRSLPSVVKSPTRSVPLSSPSVDKQTQDQQLSDPLPSQQRGEKRSSSSLFSRSKEKNPRRLQAVASAAKDNSSSVVQGVLSFDTYNGSYKDHRIHSAGLGAGTVALLGAGLGRGHWVGSIAFNVVKGNIDSEDAIEEWKPGSYSIQDAWEAQSAPLVRFLGAYDTHAASAADTKLYWHARFGLALQYAFFPSELFWNMGPVIQGGFVTPLGTSGWSMEVMGEYLQLYNTENPSDLAVGLMLGVQYSL